MKANDINRTSLGLNVVLALVCIIFVFHRPAATSNPTPSSGVSVEQSAAESRPTSSVVKENLGRSEPRNWIDVLRSEGVPEKVLARLALSDFEDRWQPRQAEAQEAYNRGDLDADGLAVLAQKHDIEEENDLRNRLGEEGFRRWDQDRLFQQFNLSNVSLTASETNSLYDLAANLRRHLHDLEKAKQGNEIDQATFSAEQTKAQADFEKQLRALVGDERYSAMRGTDPTVGELRRSLRGLNLDDQQFATLLQTQQQWDAARSQLEQQQVEIGGTNLQLQINALTEKHDQTFASVLGTNSLALFQKQQDSRYVEMKRHADTWGLDDTAADYVYRTINYYEKAVAEYQRQINALQTQGQPLDREEVNKTVQQFAQQTEQGLRSYLGDERFDKIKNNEILPFASTK